MKIQINDTATEIPANLTITTLLAHQKVKMPDMVSVQVNGTILERKDFDTTPVRENDSVEFLYFMGGGAR
jgi:sulfur carrier protein